MQIQQNPDTVQANFEEFEVSSPLLLDKSSTLLGGAVGDSILTPAQRFFVETKEMNHLLEFFAKCKHPTPETKRIVSASPGTSSFNFQLPPHPNSNERIRQKSHQMASETNINARTRAIMIFEIR